jgi:hypothetical protein
VVSVGWLEALERAKKRKSEDTSTHNTPPSSRVVVADVFPTAVGCRTDKTDKRAGAADEEGLEEGLEGASELGLVARWSYEFGYVSVHDPCTGEWHDLRVSDTPKWAKREAHKRKELYRGGNYRAYRLTSREIGEMLKLKRAPEPEGIVEDHPIEEED